jgi:transposase
MEREILEQYFDRGLSLERIAELVGKHPSTVGYWAKKHGLVNPRAATFAARGGIDRHELARWVEDGLSLNEMAARLDRSVATVRYWLERYGLETLRAQWRRDPSSKPLTMLRECEHHGQVEYRRTGARGIYRCPDCAAVAVASRRRRVKEILVDEAGGRCVICGYRASMRALQFHHIDPAEKEFEISYSGNTVALERLRTEVKKCVLLCANCHAEAEDGSISTTLLRDLAREVRRQLAA